MRIINLSVMAMCAMLIGSADAVAQIQGRPAPPRNGVCFYDDINFGGDYFCAEINATNGLLEMNDRISSIRVFGNAEVIVYQDRNFAGRSQTFTADVADLRPAGWDDAITSFRVQTAPDRAAGGGGNRWGRPATPTNGVCFYENINFEGQYFCARQGESIEMVPEGSNDGISSIRLFGNAEIVVFRDRDFRGGSRWFDASETDLRDSGWNDTISSFRVEARGASGNRGRAYGRDSGRGLGSVGGVEPSSGSVEWRGRVDERLQLVIRGRSLEERTQRGTRSGAARSTFQSGLPAEPVRVNVRLLAGPGEVRVVQQPSRQNDYTAIVEIIDTSRSGEEHRLQVNWR
jgi:hypothetical protein